MHLASIVDTLRHEDDIVPDFQRVTITGEETSGVSFLIGRIAAPAIDRCGLLLQTQ